MSRRICFLSLIVILAGSLLAGAEVTGLSCIQTAPTEYRLSYSLTGDSHKVQIFASTDPAGANRMNLLRKTSATNVTVHAGSAGQRMYFFIKPDHGEQREVSIRHIQLEGTPNFRDLGGYETTDGRFVKWGVLYRAGVLSGLTASDLTYLSQLGVKVVCDFRTAQENIVAPERWIDNPSVIRVSAPIGSNGANGKVTSLKTLLANNPTPEELRVRMETTYRAMVLDGAPEFAIAFRQLVDGPLPMLYHCTAGKDRTGVFSALVLLSLGVPENTVVEDYTLTDKYLDTAGRKQMAAASGNHDIAAIPPALARVMMAADPEVLRSALTAAREKYGSLDDYRRQALHISDEDLEKVKSRLLTK